MKERTAKMSGKKFWGCSAFPKCDGVVWPNKAKEPPKSTPPLKSEWPQPDPRLDTKIPTPLSNHEYRMCAANNAALLMSRYLISNGDMSIVDIREEWEKMFQFILSEICK
jgi:ssDNA-binding Zn-finger/Zn-ribbon topoisomerase 1